MNCTVQEEVLSHQHKRSFQMPLKSKKPCRSEKSSSTGASACNTMDDVDRLFECFRCGVSPPQSAVKEKTNRSSRFDSSMVKRSPIPTGQGKKKTSDINMDMENQVSAANRPNKFDAGKQLSPIVFYGSPHGVPPKRPLSFLRLLREIRLELAEKDKSNLRKEIWATFPKQDDAMRFMKKHANINIFCYQDHFNGQRRFLVSSYNEFWKRYKNLDPKYRHHYEVIQEGLPCHLYFDLEFNLSENADRDGNLMVDLLISVIFDVLVEKYSIKGGLDWIVELDSSTKEKFSRHLVIRIPKAAFKDNSHAGAFVSEICSRIRSAKEKDSLFEQLFVSKISSSSGPCVQLFVDDSVYSRNRCFRLALSSKAGKNSVLLPTGRYKCKDMCEEEMFFASLICNMDDDCEKLLVCKMELDCVKTLQYDTEVKYRNNEQNGLGLREFGLKNCQRNGSTTYFLGKSPFPALDAFIESVASFGNSPGKIRCWYYLSEYSLMVYSMSMSRYCERMGREHKSNHVMYVVDLEWALYYQKCYDPDCRGYRSPSRPVPFEVVPESFSSNSTGCTKDSVENGSMFSECNTLDLDTSGEDTDRWWLEAIKVADTTESWNAPFETHASDEDEEWWTEVERATARTVNI